MEHQENIATAGEGQWEDHRPRQFGVARRSHFRQAAQRMRSEPVEPVRGPPLYRTSFACEAHQFLIPECRPRARANPDQPTNASTHHQAARSWAAIPSDQDAHTVLRHAAARVQHSAHTKTNRPDSQGGPETRSGEPQHKATTRQQNVPSWHGTKSLQLRPLCIHSAG